MHPSLVVSPIVDIRTGLGWDSHRIAAGRPLLLAGVLIQADFGLDGHSDADVLAHAVTDALLGAAALGDIGLHFPDTDPQWKGADSLQFLHHTCLLYTSPWIATCAFLHPPAPMNPLINLDIGVRPRGFGRGVCRT